MKFLSSILLINLFLSSCQHRCEPEIFLIPEGYKGPIYIIYNQKDGNNKEYESKKRVYRIPISGILFTKFRDDYGFVSQEFFYITKNNERIKLYDFLEGAFNRNEPDNKHHIKPSKKSLFVINGSTGNLSKGKSEFKFQFSFVGSYLEYEKFNESLFPAIDYNYIDSVRANKTNGL